jgi:predicted nucleic acid-binding Zn ribbon protein
MRKPAPKPLPSALSPPGERRRVRDAKLLYHSVYWMPSDISASCVSSFAQEIDGAVSSSVVKERVEKEQRRNHGKKRQALRLYLQSTLGSHHRSFP